MVYWPNLEYEDDRQQLRREDEREHSRIVVSRQLTLVYSALARYKAIVKQLTDRKD